VPRLHLSCSTGKAVVLITVLGNSIESGNAGIKIGRGDSWDQPSWTQSAQPSESDTTAQWIDGLVGSPFGNGNGDGNGNAAVSSILRFIIL